MHNTNMIHGNTNDPVLIKKIPLRVWSLKDEIAFTLSERTQGMSPEEREKVIADIKNEYFGESTSPLGEINDADELDDSEDAMAAALAAADSGEEESDKGEEDEQAAGDDSSIVTIKQVRPPLSNDRFANGQLVLAEIDMESVSFFCDREFLKGQSIVIEFILPQNFIINAEVHHSRAYNRKSKIISETRPPFRINAIFSFLKKGERTLLRDFIKSIEPDFPDAPEPGPSDDGGGLSELDELDL